MLQFDTHGATGPALPDGRATRAGTAPAGPDERFRCSTNIARLPSSAYGLLSQNTDVTFLDYIFLLLETHVPLALGVYEDTSAHGWIGRDFS